LKISIIIPILNESENIGNLLTYLIENSTPKNIREIIVVDGGSTDGSQELVTNFIQTEKLFQLILINSPKGRAIQMNTGTEKATGEILYFLHADSYPPKNYDQFIINEAKNGFLAGCFRMKFDSNHPVLKFSQWFTRFNYKSCRGGDQSLYILKYVFKELKGYDENYLIYEDCEFINRIYDNVPFKVIPKTITTSSRRYNTNGTWKLQYHFTVIHLKKWLGTSPEKLSSYYFKNIVS